VSKYDFLLPANQVPGDSYRFGTITAANPLRVRLDGDLDPVEVTPTSVNESGGIGERVLVLIHNRQLILLGRVRTDFKSIPNTVNLNSLRASGEYWVLGNSDAEVSRNFPVGIAGRLTVSSISPDFTEQRYRTWSLPAGLTREFVRDYYVDGWRPWQEVQIASQWNTLTLANSWTNLGGSYAPARWRRVGNSVQLDGVLVPPSGSAMTNNPFALPAEARPSYNQLLNVNVYRHASDTTKGDRFRMLIQTSGSANMQDFNITYTPAWVSLTGVIFPLD